MALLKFNHIIKYTMKIFSTFYEFIKLDIWNLFVIWDLIFEISLIPRRVTCFQILVLRVFSG